MQKYILLILSFMSLLIFLNACPEKREKVIKEIGGAPKRLMDKVQNKVDQANKDAKQRLKKIEEEL